MQDLWGQFESTVGRLLDHGRGIGPFLPWHNSDDPFKWLVAELLLRRTTRTAAHKAYLNLLAEFKTFEELSIAEEQEIEHTIGWIGLGKQRSKQLKGLAQMVVSDFGGAAPTTRETLTQLPGVGKYIADVLLLYVHKECCFPVDPNIQRIVRRVLLLPTSLGTRHSEPYKDLVVNSVVQGIIEKKTSSEIIDIHRGMLDIAWKVCRPKPACPNCSLIEGCAYGQTLGVQ